MLQVTIMQHGADGNASAATFVPVSEMQFCSTKEGAATRCALTFRGGDLTSAFVKGQPLYLGFESTNVTQVRGARVAGRRPMYS